MVSISYCFSQNMAVSGVINSSADKAPVIGASIMIKGTQIGTISDLDGKYTISVSKGSTLVISYVGMIAQEITVTSSVINVELKENAQVLDEMVVIGYGTRKKIDNTASITSIKAEEISKTKVLNASQAIQGKAAGVQVISSDLISKYDSTKQIACCKSFASIARSCFRSSSDRQ